MRETANNAIDLNNLLMYYKTQNISEGCSEFFYNQNKAVVCVVSGVNPPADLGSNICRVMQIMERHGF